MGDSVNFAQEQENIGRAYMNGMGPADYEETLSYAKTLMASAPIGATHWQTLSDFDNMSVPEKWKKHGIQFINYDENTVWFGWHGGAFAHTHLRIDQKTTGTYIFTAHYSDNEPPKLLK